MKDVRDLQGKHAHARSMLETQCSYSIDAQKKSTRPITGKQRDWSSFPRELGLGREMVSDGRKVTLKDFGEEIFISSPTFLLPT